MSTSSRGVPCRLSGSPLKGTLRTNCTARETARDVMKEIGLPLAPVVLLDSPHKIRDGN
jgi:hypothetical protein